jgi:hypothetical protein
MKGNYMKKVAIPSLLLIAIFSLTFSACGGSHEGSNGNIFEKMAIFSLICFAAFSIFIVSFGGSKRKNNRLSGKTELIQSGSYPLSATDLISYPVYIWDYRSSFHKIVFNPDGVLLTSASVSTDYVDPAVTADGTWSLNSDGKVVLTRNSTGTTKLYTRISRHASAVLMQPDSGLVEAWYVGPGSLANIQISIFGYSELVPVTMKFSSAFVSGKTFYWATYPCLVVTISGEVAVNQETSYGMITFNDDGILTKSINHKIDSTPDYMPSISGIWSVDDESGVLTMNVLGFTTTASILIREPENDVLLVSSSAGNRIWFSDPANAPDNLDAYILEATTLVPKF